MCEFECVEVSCALLEGDGVGSMYDGTGSARRYLTIRGRCSVSVEGHAVVSGREEVRLEWFE